MTTILVGFKASLIFCVHRPTTVFATAAAEGFEASNNLVVDDAILRIAAKLLLLVLLAWFTLLLLLMTFNIVTNPRDLLLLTATAEKQRTVKLLERVTSNMIIRVQKKMVVCIIIDRPIFLLLNVVVGVFWE